MLEDILLILPFFWDLRVLYNDWARRDGCTGWAVRIQINERVTGSNFSTPRLGLLQDVLCLLLLTLPLYLDPFPLTYLHSVCGTGFCCGTVTKQTLSNCYKSLFLFLVLLGCLPSFKEFFSWSSQSTPALSESPPRNIQAYPFRHPWTSHRPVTHKLAWKYGARGPCWFLVGGSAGAPWSSLRKHHVWKLCPCVRGWLVQWKRGRWSSKRFQRRLHSCKLGGNGTPSA